METSLNVSKGDFVVLWFEDLDTPRVGDSTRKVQEPMSNCQDYVEVIETITQPAKEVTLSKICGDIQDFYEEYRVVYTFSKTNVTVKFSSRDDGRNG